MNSKDSEIFFNAIKDIDLYSDNINQLKTIYTFDLKKDPTQEQVDTFLINLGKTTVFKLTGVTPTTNPTQSDTNESSITPLKLMQISRYKLFMHQELHRIMDMKYEKNDNGNSVIISDKDLIYLQGIVDAGNDNNKIHKVLKNSCPGLYNVIDKDCNDITRVASERLNDINLVRDKNLCEKKESLIKAIRLQYSIYSAEQKSEDYKNTIINKIQQLRGLSETNKIDKAALISYITTNGNKNNDLKHKETELKQLEANYDALQLTTKFLTQEKDRLFYNKENLTSKKVHDIIDQLGFLQFKLERETQYEIKSVDQLPIREEDIALNTLYYKFDIEEKKIKICVKNFSKSQAVINHDFSFKDIGLQDTYVLSSSSNKTNFERHILNITNALNHTFAPPYIYHDPRNPKIGIAVDTLEYKNILLQIEDIEKNFERCDKLFELSDNVCKDTSKYRDNLPGPSNCLIRLHGVSGVRKLGEFKHSIIRKGSTTEDKESSLGGLEAKVVYRGVRLNHGDIKQSTCETTNGKKLCVKQDHTGKITYDSDANLDDALKALLALEIAETALLHYVPGDEISLSGSANDAELSEMVHAALLILTNVGKDIPFDPKCIKNNIAGALGPSWFGQWWNNSFMDNKIERHLSSGTTQMKDRLLGIYQKREEEKNDTYGSNLPVGIEFKK